MPQPQRPIALSDESLNEIMLLARPLDPDLRDAFLQDIANALRGYPAEAIGDGLIGRLAREIQSRYLQPLGDWQTRPSRWNRATGAFNKGSKLSA